MQQASEAESVHGAALFYELDSALDAEYRFRRK
jgi:hypothetical protein